MYRLVFHSGRLKGRRIAVRQGPLRIGRDPACQVALEDDFEAALLAVELADRPDGVHLLDLTEGQRPPRLHGRPVRDELLHPGDRFTVGKTEVEFQHAMPVVTATRRRMGNLQALTLAAVGALAVFQMVFVVLLPALTRTHVPPPPDPSLASRTNRAAMASVSTQRLVHVIFPEYEVAGPPVSAAGTAPAPTGMADVVAGPPLPATSAPPAAARLSPARQGLVAELTRIEELLVDGRAEDAESRMRALMASYPAVPELHGALAVVLERKGDLAGAGREWTEAMRLGTGTPLYDRAATEMQRVARAEVLAAASQDVDTTRRAAEVKVLPRRLRIENLERDRFAGDRDVDEIRTARAYILPRSGAEDLDPSAVRVRFLFYDRLNPAGSVVPTRAAVHRRPVPLDEPWTTGTAARASATYVVPRGFRSDERKRTGNRGEYEGVRVQILYQGELEDEDAIPAFLLNLDVPADS